MGSRERKRIPASGIPAQPWFRGKGGHLVKRTTLDGTEEVRPPHDEELRTGQEFDGRTDNAGSGLPVNLLCHFPIKFIRIKLLNKAIEAADGHLVIDPAHHLDVTVGNIINRILFTERFTEENEKKFFDIKTLLDQMMENASIFDFFLDTWNINIPPFKKRHEYILGSSMHLINFLKDQVVMR